MTTAIKCRPCQANENGTGCKKDARAKCFHCSRDLCLMHLTAHAQLAESQTRTLVRSHQTMVNDLSQRLARLSISPRVSELPFIQLEEWRREAHQRLDQLAEQKRKEIQERLAEYQHIFNKKTNEEQQKVEILKKHLNDLSRQTHLASKDIQYLEEKVNETQQFFCNIEKHSIKLSTSDFSVVIRTQFFETRVMPRNSRSEVKQPVNNNRRQRLDKRRSLSACVL